MIDIAILGADRVGKSTFAQTISGGYMIEHFGPPNYTDPNWYFQYSKLTQCRISDRGPLEAGFYRPIPESEIIEYIKLSTKWNNTKFVIISVPWSYEMMRRHKLELKNKYPDAQEWFIESLIQKAMQEHHDYYKYIFNIAYSAQVNCDVINL